MSWFDTSQLASMASKAMKEAQKTFDKALDIDAEEESAGEVKEDKVEGDDESETSWSSSWNKLVKSDPDDETQEEGANSKPASNKKRSSLWSSLSEAANLMTAGADNSPEENLSATTAADVFMEPVFSQPQSATKVESSVVDVSSAAANREVEVEEEEVDNLDQELLRESIEEGFAGARLVVTPDSGDERQLDSVGDPCTSIQPTSTCDVTSSSLSKQQDDSISVISSHQSCSSDVESVKSDVIAAPASDDSTSAIPVSDDSASIGQPESSSGGSQSFDHVTSPSTSHKHKVSGSGSSIDVISPSSIEPISCSSIDIIPTSHTTPELVNTSPDKQNSDSVVELQLDQDDVDAGHLHDGLVPGEAALNVSVGSTNTIIPRLENEEIVTVENMLSDALQEQEKKSVEGSLSSRSSDIVKIDCVSETSTDDFENQTFASSSDVDVLSSPKPDRSESMRKFEEEAKQKFRVYQDEITSLRLKNEELALMVKAREDKILSVSREISLSHEGSDQLVARLEAALKEADNLREQADHKQMLADSLEKELKSERKSGASLQKKFSKLEAELADINTNIAKKDSLISDLRQEGEALARQNGKQADTIRKLRAKEKNQESEKNLLTDKLDRLTQQHDKASKTLAEKTESETSMSKSFKTLADRNKVLEKENVSLSREVEQNKEKIKSLRSGLETSNETIAHLKEEVSQAKSVASSEAVDRETKLRQKAEQQLEDTEIVRQTDRAEYEARITSCQEALVLSEKSASQREEQLRRELQDVRSNLEKTENRYEELNIHLQEATKPLLRQIQSLQQELTKVRTSSDETERCLSDRIKNITANLNIAKEKERRAVEEYEQSSTRLAALEATVHTSHGSKSELEGRINELCAKLKHCETEIEQQKLENKQLQQDSIKQHEASKREKDLLTMRLETTIAESETRKKLCEELSTQIKDQEERLRDLQMDSEVHNSLRPGSAVNHSGTPSPSMYHNQNTLHPPNSISRENSWADDLLSPVNVPVSPFTGGSSVTPGGVTSLYDTMKHGNSAAYLESLESQLKMKDGEVAGLHQQVLQLDRIKQSLAKQLAEVTTDLENSDVKVKELELVKEQFNQCKEERANMEKKLREKEEEVQDMRQDLAYVKEKYRNQIDQLLAGSS